MSWQKAILAPLLALSATIPAFAQVERVAMRTNGLVCGVCAAASEVNLRQLKAIDKIQMNVPSRAIMVSYKPGVAFQPKDIRDALKKAEVSVVQFQISARGRVQEQGGKRFFVSGKDRFLLAVSEGAPIVPDTPLLIEGTINDEVTPMELTIMTVRPLQK